MTSGGATGGVTQLDRVDSEGTTTVGAFSYDAFGRLAQLTDSTGVDPVLRYVHSDWLSGEIEFMHSHPEGGGGGGLEGDDSDLGLGHGPGFTRLRDADAGHEAFYVRGPQGQVRWSVGADGAMQGAYSYNAWGGMSEAQQLGSGWPPGILPAYLDGDLRPLTGDANSVDSGWPAVKLGRGIFLDTTPLVGALNGPEASGAAALDTSSIADNRLAAAATAGPCPTAAAGPGAAAGRQSRAAVWRCCT